MNCSKCNAWIPDDAEFCSECGQKVEASPVAPMGQSFCPECGAPLLPDDMFCGNCGAKNDAYGRTPADGAANGGQKKGFKLPIKALIIGAAAVAVIAVVILVVSMISGGGSNSYAVYIKDRELQAAQLPKAKDPMQLTSKFVDTGDLDNEDLAGEYLAQYITLSSDGKKMFFPDKIDDDGYTLYYRDVTNSKKEAVKIDSGLEDYYFVNENGTLVTYLKNDNLYQHNLSDKTKIAGDVDDYSVSKDGKTLLYLKDYVYEEGGTLYLQKGNKDAEKIASGVTSIAFANDDLSLIMYQKDDSLYRMESGKEPEKIASDVYYVYQVYDSGACYYSKQETENITYWSIIDNDMGETGEYYREWLEEDTMSNPVRTLCYFDGKDTTVITENMLSCSDNAMDSEIFAYTTLESEELPSVKLSETYYGDGDSDIYTLLWEAIEEETAHCVAVGAKTVVLDLEDIYDVSISEDGTVYVETEYDTDDSTYSLYKVTLSNGNIKSSEMMDDEVYTCRLVSDTDIVYWKDINDDLEGELYLNGKKVDDDTYLYWALYDEDSGCLYYMVDYDEEGTLTCWNGKNSVTIADEVHSYVLAEDGQVLYLYDYSTSSYKGELYSWNGKKATKLDDDVVAVYVIRND